MGITDVLLIKIPFFDNIGTEVVYFALAVF